MTIIIAADGYMMADSLVSQGGIVSEYIDKIFTDGSEWIIGASGSVCAGQKVVDHILENGFEGLGSLVIRGGEDCFSLLAWNSKRNKLYYIDSELYPVEQPLPAFIGSGREVARGAYFATGSIRKAMEVTIQHDTNCGGDIKSIILA
jgi:hypothetical protein